MAALNFPNNPSLNDIYSANGRRWKWNGSSWIRIADPGVQGTQGTAGVLGGDGAQGTRGTQGLQGTQGIQGTQGTQGTQGLQGPQGTTGTQGIQGIQGLTGNQFWSVSSAGIATTRSVGFNTTTVNDSDLIGVGNSFKGAYVSNGMFIFDNVLHGDHYIGTAFNGLMAGPIDVQGLISVDGNFVVV